MLNDPIQVLFNAATSTFARICLAVVAFVLPLLAYRIGIGDMALWKIAFFPLYAIEALFYWGAMGVLFFPIGLLSLVGIFFLARLFVDCVDPRSVFLAIFTLALFYLHPLTYGWDEEFVRWKFACAVGVFYFLYISLGYALPALLNCLTGSRET